MPDKIDWRLVYDDYRTGQHNFTQLAAKHKVHISTVSRRAKKERWERDCAKDVEIKTRAAVMHEMPDPNDSLVGKMRKETSENMAESAREQHRKAKERREAREMYLEPKDLIEVAVDNNVEVLKQHVTAVRVGRSLANRMYSELDAQTENIGRMHELIDESAGAGTKAPAVTILKKAVSLATRAKTLHHIAGVMVKLIDAERKALNLDSRQDEEDGFAKFYSTLTKKGGQRLGDVITKKVEDDNDE